MRRNLVAIPVMLGLLVSLSACSGVSEADACPFTTNELSAAIGSPVTSREAVDMVELVGGFTPDGCNYVAGPDPTTTVNFQSIDAVEGAEYREAFFSQVELAEARPEWGELARVGQSYPTTIALFEARGRFWRIDLTTFSMEDAEAGRLAVESVIAEMRTS
jgi:hypothetical protein